MASVVPSVMDQPSATSRPERLEALTGLRFLAALIVVFRHMPAPQGGWLTKTFMASGYSGVTLFFVLSGFVIGHNYFDRFRASRTGDGLLWSYAVGRWARIYPLYLLVLIGTTLPSLRDGVFLTPMWWCHAFALQPWLPGNEAFAFNGPGWSIGVEFFFYLVFPVLPVCLVAPTRTPCRTLASMGVVVVLIGGATCAFWAGDPEAFSPDVGHRWVYRSPLLRLGDFVLGILCSRLVGGLRGPERLDRARLGAVIQAIGALSFLGLMCWPTHLSSPPSWDVSFAVPSAAIIIGLSLAPNTSAARALSVPALVLLGEASYALYLTHVGVRAAVGTVSSGGLEWWLMNARTVFVAIMFAIGLHVAFERPLRTTLRRLLDRSGA